MTRYAAILFHLLPTLIPAGCMLLFVILLSGCTMPRQQAFVASQEIPAVTQDHLIAHDGRRLPLKRWLPETDKPEAVIIALHGFNDYSHAFEGFGEFAMQHDIALYAYDQRGFGRNDMAGVWAGEANLSRDVAAMVQAVRDAHPFVSVYVLGESMGGAIAVRHALYHEDNRVDGVILVAPAIWGGKHFSDLHRLGLWLAAHTVPDMALTGEGIVEVQASDNLELLREMYDDPFIVKETRMDTLYGLMALMDNAYHEVHRLDVPTLLLYGEKDEIVPPEPVDYVAGVLDAQYSYVRYPQGYHMLLRDLQAERVMEDIVAWVRHRDRPLPSGLAVHHGFVPSYDMTKLEKTDN